MLDRPKISDYEKLMNKVRFTNFALQRKYKIPNLSFGNATFSMSDIKNCQQSILNECVTDYNIGDSEYVIFSIDRPHQLVSAIVINKMIRAIKENYKSIIIYNFTEDIKTFGWAQEYFEFMVNRDFEKQLINIIKGSQEESQLPDKLDYSDLNLRQYYLNLPVVPLRISNHCYHAKCEFCDKVSNCKNLAFKSADDLLSEVCDIYNLYGVKRFKFMDDAVPPSIIFEFAKLIINNNYDIEWTANIRFDVIYNNSEILKLLKRSGCQRLFVGLESGSQKLLNKMNKGIILDNATDIIKKSYEAGIKMDISILFNFPGEELMDVKKTISFIKDNINYINSLEVNNFVLTKNSLIYKNIEKYEIEVADDSEFKYFVDFTDNSISWDEHDKKQNVIKHFVLYLQEQDKISTDWKLNYKLWDK